jgi:hypothetical protein
MHEQYYEFEAKSHSLGKATIDLKDLWDINGILPLGDWYFKIEYIYFFNEEKYSTKNIYVESPQILTGNKKQQTLAFISKLQKETFFCFSPSEYSKSFTRLITRKTAFLDLELFFISELEIKQKFLADFTVKISITIPHGG